MRLKVQLTWVNYSSFEIRSKLNVAVILGDSDKSCQSVPLGRTPPSQGWEPGPGWVGFGSRGCRGMDQSTADAGEGPTAKWINRGSFWTAASDLQKPWTFPVIWKICPDRGCSKRRQCPEKSRYIVILSLSVLVLCSPTVSIWILWYFNKMHLDDSKWGATRKELPLLLPSDVRDKQRCQAKNLFMVLLLECKHNGASICEPSEYVHLGQVYD